MALANVWFQEFSAALPQSCPANKVNALGIILHGTFRFTRKSDEYIRIASGAPDSATGIEIRYGVRLTRRTLLYCFVFLSLVLANPGVSHADSGYPEALRAHLKRLRGMLTAIVAAMPEGKYDYRPTKEVRSFREMVIHLVSDNFTHLGYAAGKSKEDSDKLAEKYKNIKTRSEFLAALNDSYDYGDKVLAGLNDQNAMDKVVAMRGEHTNRVGAVLEAFEDEMDHYGNFVVYLRLNGVVPPETENRDKQVEENMHH